MGAPLIGGYGRGTLRLFSGIELINDWISAETTILPFRCLLEKRVLGDQIYCLAEDCVYESVNSHLSARGMMMLQGTFNNASLIAALRFINNQEWKRDLEIHQTRKANSRIMG